MNWQLWSETQAVQILTLRRRVKRLRWELTVARRRTQLWRQRALDRDAKR